MNNSGGTQQREGFFFVLCVYVFNPKKKVLRRLKGPFGTFSLLDRFYPQLRFFLLCVFKSVFPRFLWFFSSGVRFFMYLKPTKDVTLEGKVKRKRRVENLQPLSCI